MGQTDPAISDLISALEAGDSVLRWAAIEELAALGEKAAPAVSALCRTLEAAFFGD